MWDHSTFYLVPTLGLRCFNAEVIFFLVFNQNLILILSFYIYIFLSRLSMFYIEDIFRIFKDLNTII